ncbi:MAG: hypothetical protein SAK29_02575 [Scytonema sp. PMC 1069.18]|nr:hypothetical protein [Scytonema sp. PMC 1069.18]MEC4881692.1 hypothetical protein [Scytonema sp. PMC 1070.18]
MNRNPALFWDEICPDVAGVAILENTDTIVANNKGELLILLLFSFKPTAKLCK